MLIFFCVAGVPSISKAYQAGMPTGFVSSLTCCQSIDYSSATFIYLPDSYLNSSSYNYDYLQQYSTLYTIGHLSGASIHFLYISQNTYQQQAGFVFGFYASRNNNPNVAVYVFLNSEIVNPNSTYDSGSGVWTLPGYPVNDAVVNNYYNSYTTNDSTTIDEYITNPTTTIETTVEKVVASVTEENLQYASYILYAIAAVIALILAIKIVA